MGKRIELRTMSAEETDQVKRLARSRSAEARLVQRARLIEAMLEDPRLSASAAALKVGYGTERAGTRWLKRFNEQGLAGLADEPRVGRPRTHSEAVRSSLIGLARRKPASLGLPFQLWTLERLQREFESREGVHLSDSTIWEWLTAEGLAWKRQESWFHDAEQADPDFVEKRGRL